MNYQFIASSMLIFTVTLASGLTKDIQFDPCGIGAYMFATDQKEVAEAIRRHPLCKQGRITDTSQPEEVQQKKVEEEKARDENVLRFENITKAKNYLTKTFKVDGRSMKGPESVKAVAKEHGVEIEF